MITRLFYFVFTGYIREGFEQPRLLQCGRGWYHLPTAEGERRKEEVDKDNGRRYLLPRTEEGSRMVIEVVLFPLIELK